MKFSILVSAILFAFLPCAIGNDITQEGIAELVSKLGSNSFKERERATDELWVVGQPAIDELRKAARSEDPEVAFRASEVLEKVELRITPDTPPEILAKIRRYRDGSLEVKVDLLTELKSRRAYFQVLKLVENEEEPEVKIRLLPVVRGVAIAGARVAITQDDFKTAEELLKMSAIEPTDMMALACLYRTMGLLEEGLEMPAAPANVPTGLWEITLLRAKGDLEGAIKVASRFRQSQQLAGLKVLTGDPTLWLRQNGTGDPDLAALDSYVDLALKRWNGGRIDDADLAPLMAVAKAKDSDSKRQAIASLAALARPRLGEEDLEEGNPTIAFLYYLSAERIDDAFAVIGIDSEKPQFTEWVRKRFDLLLAAEEGEQEIVDDSLMYLLLLASFMELRGLDEEYMAAFEAPLADLAKERQEVFLNFMRVQFEGRLGAPKFAVHHASQWAGDDEGRWSELFRLAFGTEDAVMEWVGWISQIEPDTEPAEKMKVIMALFGVGGDNGGLAKKWIAAAWDYIEAQPEDQREPMIRRMLMLAISRQDVINSLKAREMLDPESRGATFLPDLDKYLTAVDRWEDAANILRANLPVVSTSAESHALAAATMRKAGFEEDAAVHDAWAEKLALGQASVSNRVAKHYTYGEDPVRAIKWYRRSAFEADMSGVDFANSLGDYAQAMLESGEWLTAASCFEALAQVKVSRRFSGEELQTYTKARLSADLARALSILDSDRELAVSTLDDLHEIFITDGVLADDFFPMVRKAGLVKELEVWFSKSWQKLIPVIEKYPASDNTRNTAGWLASRACLKLDEGEEHMKAALEMNPDQAAYLDTMAEVQFAKGDRKAAVEWSSRAISFYPLTESPSDVMIRKQHQRFKNAPLPLK